MATFTSFLACTSACLAESWSNPIDTNIAMDSSDGSIGPTRGAEKFLSTCRPAYEGAELDTLLIPFADDGLLVDGQDSRENSEAMKSGNFALRM